MSYLRSYKSWIYTINVYKCDECGCEINESFPKVVDEEKHYCIECAFKKNMISEVDYCDSCGGISSYMFAAGVNPYTKEIELTNGKVKSVKIKNHFKNVRTKRGNFTWEKTETQLRKDKRYKIWRESVIKRDSKCCHCGTTKNLVAHHIKPIKTHKELVFEVENGMTLCSSCHPKEHARMRRELKDGRS